MNGSVALLQRFMSCEGSPAELCVLVGEVDYDFATVHIPTILFPVIIVTLFHLSVIAGIAYHCLFVSYHFWKTLLKLLSSFAVT